MPETAIIAALEREVGPLLKSAKRVKREYAGRSFTFFERREFVIVCGGIGSEPARRAAEAVIALYHPAVLHSVGFAGALQPELRVGDVFSVSTVIDARDGSRVEVERGNCVLLTFGTIAGVKQKSTLAQAYGANAIDMEAASVAAAACAHGLRFRATKVISDAFDFEMPGMDLFTDAQGRFRTVSFVIFAALRPWLWGRVLRLARNGSKAAKVLAAYLIEHTYQASPAAEDKTL
jgi:adenosylhomocysteine nucleosidase